jgi:hypothetical protein
MTVNDSIIFKSEAAIGRYKTFERKPQYRVLAFPKFLPRRCCSTAYDRQSDIEAQLDIIAKMSLHTRREYLGYHTV